MRPPILSTIPNEIESPSPVPSCGPFVVKNGSRTRSRISGGIPSPVSVTVTTTHCRLPGPVTIDTRGLSAAPGALLFAAYHAFETEVEHDLLELVRISTGNDWLGRSGDREFDAVSWYCAAISEAARWTDSFTSNGSLKSRSCSRENVRTWSRIERIRSRLSTMVVRLASISSVAMHESAIRRTRFSNANESVFSG